MSPFRIYSKVTTYMVDNMDGFMNTDNIPVQ